MTTEAVTEKNWVAPGPGAWERDPAHQERPFSRLWLDVAGAAFAAGTGEAFRRFGLPFQALEIADVEGWFFGTFAPLAEEDFPARMEAAEAALATRPWRAVADEWHGSTKSVIYARSREIQAVDPAGLDDAALADHLADAFAFLHDAARVHFLDAIAHWVGVGLLACEAERLAGWGPERAVQALAGASPNSTAPVVALHRLSSAIAADGRAAEELASGREPPAVLRALDACSPPVREALRAYLEEHGWQVFTGFDLTHQAMIEMPGLLIETIRNAAPPPAARPDLLAELRDACPPGERAQLETVIEDALLLYGLRDDDSGLTTQLPIGLVRRALLAAGSRLAARGDLLDSDDIFDAKADELTALLAGAGRRPSADELARRATRRREPGPVPPRRLGEEEPPPEGALPPAMEAVMGAMFAAMSLEDTPTEATPTGGGLHGAAASAGVYEGRARVVHDAGDFERIEHGDVLVAPMTTPAYNVLLPLLGAVVTDRGGVLSHPAIVAREYGIPAVVGTGDATARIPDGARVRVDGVAGTVTILP